VIFVLAPDLNFVLCTFPAVTLSRSCAQVPAEEVVLLLEFRIVGFSTSFCRSARCLARRSRGLSNLHQIRVGSRPLLAWVFRFEAVPVRAPVFSVGAPSVFLFGAQVSAQQPRQGALDFLLTNWGRSVFVIPRKVRPWCWFRRPGWLPLKVLLTRQGAPDSIFQFCAQVHRPLVVFPTHAFFLAFWFSSCRRFCSLESPSQWMATCPWVHMGFTYPATTYASYCFVDWLEKSYMSFSFLCDLSALVLQSNSAQAHQPFFSALRSFDELCSSCDSTVVAGGSRSCSWVTGPKAQFFLFYWTFMIISWRRTQDVWWNAYEGESVVVGSLVTLAYTVLCFSLCFQFLTWFWGSVAFL
jgi:hypothetical protein